MSALDVIFLGNSVAAWLAAVAISAVVTLGLVAVRGTLAKRLAAMVGNTETRLDDIVFDLINETHFLFLLVVGLYAGTYPLALPADLRSAGDTAMTIAVLGQGGIWGSHLISDWVSNQAKRKAAEDVAGATALGVIGMPLRLALWSVVVLVGLDNVGVDVTALIAGLGIGGIAIALAAQNILGDLFSSLSIVLDRPFSIGDFIIVDDKMGTVERIGLKTTRVRALSGELIIFANADLLQSRVRNYKQMYVRRIVFGLGVTYQTPADTIEAIPVIVREIIEAQPNARFDRGHFKAFGDFSLDFEFVYYVTVPDYAAYADTQQAINFAILRRFEADGIEFAYPTQTLFVEREAAAKPSRPAPDPKTSRAGASGPADDEAPAVDGGDDG